MMCIFVGRLSVEIGFTTMSLAYGAELLVGDRSSTNSDHPSDLLAFSVIIYVVVRSNITRVPIPRLLKSIVQDATYYFLFIFTSHLLLVMFLAFGSVSVSL